MRGDRAASRQARHELRGSARLPVPPGTPYPLCASVASTLRMSSGASFAQNTPPCTGCRGAGSMSRGSSFAGEFTSLLTGTVMSVVLFGISRSVTSAPMSIRGSSGTRAQIYSKPRRPGFPVMATARR